MNFKQAPSKGIYEELCQKYPASKDVWRYFLEMTEIPRPSGHTQQIGAWAVERGKELGGTTQVDHLGNVCIRFPASDPSLANVPGIVLQGHLDMVGTKTPENTHVFARDPIQVYIDGPVLRARNTTLGGDDGIGIAAALAIAADKSLKRGPLELLFTVDEETGLIGALGLKEGELLSPQAKYLINLDCEDWGELCLSCAGGVDRLITVPLVRTAHEDKAAWKSFVMTLKDFRGGHTGVEIHSGRANAVKWAAQILSQNAVALAGTAARIHTFNGGNAHNAVPSLCEVEFSVPSAVADDYVKAATAIFDGLLAVYAPVEKTANITFKPLPEGPTTPQGLTQASSGTVLSFINACPHGVWRWSEAIASHVETSQSLSVFTVGPNDAQLQAEVFARSSKNESLETLGKQLAVLAELYGGKCVPKCEDCPGWPAEPNSRLCKETLAHYQKLFGSEMKVTPIHAGLECGIIINKFPQNKIEAVAVGPTVKDPHTIAESMDIDSCDKLYKLVHAVIEALAK